MKIIYMLAVCLLAGCATAPKPLYYWGNYPEQTYLMYSASDKASPSQQIQKMQVDIEKARAKNLPLPPGFYAHLGLMYLDEGNMQRAEEYFNLERQVYPESNHLIERMLSQKKPDLTVEKKQ